MNEELVPKVTGRRAILGALAAAALVPTLLVVPPTSAEGVEPMASGADHNSRSGEKPLPGSAQVLTADHLVDHISTVPANAGEPVQLHLRERARPGVQGRARHHADPAVLFVPGSATSAVPAYDLAFEDYSWMVYLARAGFDVFAIDLTGYGHSPRPKMDDPCNVSVVKQELLVPNPLAEPCPHSYAFRLAHTHSEQDELDAAVDYIRALRGVERVSLVGWSLGALRSGLYAAAHPEKVDRLVFDAPTYARTFRSTPGPLPPAGSPMDIRIYADQVNWLGTTTPCDGQVDDAVKAPMWATVKAYDPLGASWGQPGAEGGVMRFPLTTQWGFNQTATKKIKAPTLIIRGASDTSVSKLSVQNLYDDLINVEPKNKALVADIPCASHFMIWESQRHELHRLSSAWLANAALPPES